MKQHPRWLGYVMILASAICFGSYGVWSRLLGGGFDIFFQGWVRSAIILAILLPLLIATKDWKPIFTKESKWFWVTMIFTVFTQVPIYYAFNHMALGTATLIFYATFLITSYVVGWLFLGEKILGTKAVSFVVAIAGLVLTFGLSLAVFSAIALLLAGLNGIASGGEVATSKKSTHHYSTLQLTTCSWLLIMVTHLPISIVLGEHQLVPTLSVEWLAMIGYSISGLLGFWLVIEGFKYVDASIGGLIGLLEIIFSFVFGVYLFKDAVTPSMIIGGILILTAAMIPDVYSLINRKQRLSTPAPKGP